MRPPLLNPLFAGAAGLKGIGAKLDKLLASFLRPAHGTPRDTTRIVDLLLHGLKSRLADRRIEIEVSDEAKDFLGQQGWVATVRGKGGGLAGSCIAGIGLAARAGGASRASTASR